MVADFFHGDPELQRIIALSAERLAPLDGFDTEFFRLDLNLNGFVGYYGPIERKIADSLNLLARQSYEDLEAFRTAFNATSGDPRYHSYILGAVDCALWDARAKQAKKSVAELSGVNQPGKSVPCYASMITLDIDRSNTQEIAEGLSRLGFWGQKWDLPEGPENGTAGLKRNVHRLKKLREAASDGRLMIELHRRWTPEYLRAFITEIGNMDITWLEDPFPAENATNYFSFKKGNIPICLGEKLTSPEGFDRYMEGNYILQPDIIACGGYTAASKIVRSAAEHKQAVVFHGRWLIPSFHLAIALPHNQVIEFNPIFEPERQIAMEQRVIPENGFLHFLSNEWSGLWQS